MKRGKSAGGRASGKGAALAFFITAAVVFLAVRSVPVREGERGTDEKQRITREITLSGGACAVVHFGLYERADEARIAAARYVCRGAGGYVYNDASGYYAAGCLFESEEEALEMQKSICGRGIDCGVLLLEAPEIRLRATAEEEELRLIEAGYRAYVNAERELMRISSHLDAGNIDAQEARSLISVLRFDVEALRDQALASARNAHGTGKQLFSLLSDGLSCALLENGGASGGEMRLSSQVKYAAMDMRIRRYRFLTSL